MAEERVPQLDGIRGVAIGLVLLWHFTIMPLAYTHSIVGRVLRFAGQLSWSGVDLFFVLSGFLIGGILIDHREADNYFSTFYVRRAFRILPLYLVMVAGILLLARDPPPMPAWAYLSFTNNLWMSLHDQWEIALGQTWSLAVEEQFYLMLPLLVRLVPPRRLALTCVAFVLSAPIFRIACVGWNTAAVHTLLPCRFDSLLLGVLGAVLLRTHRAATIRAAPVFLGISAIGVLALMLLKPRIGSMMLASWGYSTLAVFYLGLLLCSLRGGFLGRVASLAPLRRLGVLAYGLYLIHGVLLGLPARGALLASVLLAELSWRFLEKPALRFAHGFRYSALAAMTPRQKKLDAL